MGGSSQYAIYSPSRPNIPRQHVLKLRSRLLHHVLHVLKLKQPEAKSVDLSTIVSSDSLPCDPHPVITRATLGVNPRAQLDLGLVLQSDVIID